MALTRPFKVTVQERARRDPGFRQALLQEAVQCYFNGEPEIAKSVLRDYINATVGFKQLAEETHRSPKSLMRMFGPGGNPKSNNLFDVFRCLQEHEGVRLEVAVIR